MDSRMTQLDFSVKKNLLELIVLKIKISRIGKKKKKKKVFSDPFWENREDKYNTSKTITQTDVILDLKINCSLGNEFKTMILFIIIVDMLFIIRKKREKN